jgi:hypothetical protein
VLELLNMLMCMGGAPPRPPAPPPPPPPPSPPAPIAEISTQATVARKTGGKGVGTTKTKMARRAKGKSRFTRPLSASGPTGLNIG